MNACDIATKYFPLLGRILLANIFIVAGYRKIFTFAATAGYMESKGLPATDLLLVLTIIIELGGGLMILLGWHARWAALAIALFLVPVTFVFHAYWGLEPAQMMEQQRAFFKNMGLLGAMLYIVAYGSGPFSLRKDRCGEQ